MVGSREDAAEDSMDNLLVDSARTSSVLSEVVTLCCCIASISVRTSALPCSKARNHVPSGGAVGEGC